MHKAITLSAAVEKISEGSPSWARLNHALRAIRTYLVECADNKNWSDKHTAELNEVIRNCVERIAVNRRDPAAAADARLPLEPLRHAIQYVDEHLDTNLRHDDMRLSWP